MSGFIGIEDIAGFAELAPYISWYSDYTANTSSSQGVAGIGMLWGAKGSACKDVYSPRLEAFTDLVDTNKTVPEIMFGFYEPDCDCSMSSDMSVSSAASAWDKLVVPLAAKGTVLGSPSMCKQYNEDFLTSFNSSIKQSWDVTSIHINKPNVSEAMKDVEYYVQKYQKPIWVSEFACVHDEDGFEPCTDQGDIDHFINDMVVYLENSTDVVAYGASNGAGLGKTWPLFDSPGSGELTKSGQTYLNALKKLYVCESSFTCVLNILTCITKLSFWWLPWWSQPESNRSSAKCYEYTIIW